MNNTTNGNFCCWRTKNESTGNILVDMLLIIDSIFGFKTSTFISLLLRYHHVEQVNIITCKCVDNLSQKNLQNSNYDNNSLKKLSQSCQRH